jgi:hypothetical protein
MVGIITSSILLLFSIFGLPVIIERLIGHFTGKIKLENSDFVYLGLVSILVIGTLIDKTTFFIRQIS